MSDARLIVDVRANTADAVRGLNGVSGAAGKMGGALKRAGAGILLGAGAVGAWSVGAIKSAGDLQQSYGAVDTVFKGTAKQMHSFAATADQTVGLSKNSYNELATIIGTQLKNGGTSIDKIGGKTNDLIKTGADLSSMFGGTTKDAVAALSSALKGERDPIERYGVSLTQAKIDAEAAALGFKKVGGTYDATAQQAATLSLITKQTSDAHGNFAKESGTLQGKQQRLSAQYENMKTTIGGALLPIASSFFGYLNDTAGPAVSKLVSWFGTLDFSSFTSGITGAGGVLATLRPRFDEIVTAAGNWWTSMQPVIATVRDELIPKISQLAQTVIPPVVSAIMSIVPPLISAAGSVQALAVAILQRLMPVFNALAPVVVTVFDVVAGAVRAGLAVVTNTVKIVTAILTGDWSRAWDLIKKAPGLALDLIKKTVGGALKIVVSIISAQMGLARSAMSAAWSTIQKIPGAAFDIIKSAVSRALSAVVGLLRSQMGQAKNAMSNAWTSIQNAASGAWTRVKSAVSTGISNVVTAVKELPGKAKSALGNLGSTLFRSGQDLIAGFIKGIARAAGGIASTIKSAVTDKIPGWIKGPLGINSPSRVMAEIAQWIPKGIAVGIDRNAGAVRSAMSTVAGDVAGTPFTAPAVPPASAAAGAARSSGRGAPVVQITITGAVDPLATARQIRKLLSDYDMLVRHA